MCTDLSSVFCFFQFGVTKIALNGCVYFVANPFLQIHFYNFYKKSISENFLIFFFHNQWKIKLFGYFCFSPWNAKNTLFCFLNENALQSMGVRFAFCAEKRNMHSIFLFAFCVPNQKITQLCFAFSNKKERRIYLVGFLFPFVWERQAYGHLFAPRWRRLSQGPAPVGHDLLTPAVYNFTCNS